MAKSTETVLLDLFNSFSAQLNNRAALTKIPDLVLPDLKKKIQTKKIHLLAVDTTVQSSSRVGLLLNLVFLGCMWQIIVSCYQMGLPFVQIAGSLSIFFKWGLISAALSLLPLLLEFNNRLQSGISLFNWQTQDLQNRLIQISFNGLIALLFWTVVLSLNLAPASQSPETYAISTVSQSSDTRITLHVNLTSENLQPLELDLLPVHEGPSAESLKRGQTVLLGLEKGRLGIAWISYLEVLTPAVKGQSQKLILWPKAFKWPDL